MFARSRPHPKWTPNSAFAICNALLVWVRMSWRDCARIARTPAPLAFDTAALLLVRGFLNHSPRTVQPLRSGAQIEDGSADTSMVPLHLRRLPGLPFNHRLIRALEELDYCGPDVIQNAELSQYCLSLRTDSQR